MEITNPLLKDRLVLIADDDELTRNLLRNVLRALGMRIVGDAGDGQRALELFGKAKPEIVCLDIDMPKLSGLEVLARIREQDQIAVVLMISGATTGDNVRGAIAGRADGIIAKPFNTAKIVRELERAVGRLPPRSLPGAEPGKIG
jgi:two-component system, chemotaxis family, chemotaxis protein CheY